MFFGWIGKSFFILLSQAREVIFNSLIQIKYIKILISTLIKLKMGIWDV